jgi:hypothetical protein
MDSAIYKDFARCHQAGCRTALTWPPARAALSSHRRAGRAIARWVARCGDAEGPGPAVHRREAALRRATARTPGTLGWARPDHAVSRAAPPGGGASSRCACCRSCVLPRRGLRRAVSGLRRARRSGAGRAAPASSRERQGAGWRTRTEGQRRRAQGRRSSRPMPEWPGAAEALARSSPTGSHRLAGKESAMSRAVIYQTHGGRRTARVACDPQL